MNIPRRGDYRFTDAEMRLYNVAASAAVEGDRKRIARAIRTLRRMSRIAARCAIGHVWWIGPTLSEGYYRNREAAHQVQGGAR